MRARKTYVQCRRREAGCVAENQLGVSALDGLQRFRGELLQDPLGVGLEVGMAAAEAKGWG